MTVFGNLWLVALGGASGAVLRYLIALGTHLIWGDGFPTGTLVANLLGCGLMGVIITLQPQRAPDSFYLLVAVGFLGSMTTFSAFSADTFRLLEDGAAVKAVCHVLANVIGCYLTLLAGIFVTSWLRAS